MCVSSGHGFISDSGLSIFGLTATHLYREVYVQPESNQIPAGSSHSILHSKTAPRRFVFESSHHVGRWTLSLGTKNRQAPAEHLVYNFTKSSHSTHATSKYLRGNLLSHPLCESSGAQGRLIQNDKFFSNSVPDIKKCPPPPFQAFVALSPLFPWHVRCCTLTFVYPAIGP